MHKNLLKWMLIVFCIFIMCGTFYLYVAESINSIILEQTTLKSVATQEILTPFAIYEQEGKAVSYDKSLAGAQESPPSAEISNPYSAPSGNTDSTAPWRIIEKSKNNVGQLQYYSRGNVNLDGGRVVITTREEPMDDKSYTSGMVESSSAYIYGKFSFVISVSEGNGLFPAIWLMPMEDKALPEIDIFEMIGSEPDEFYGVLHYLDNSIQKRIYYKTRVDKKDTYHIELEWTQERLRWFVDGECMLETLEFIPNEPMYVIVNQAVGGSWAGSPNNATVFPATFILESWAVEPEWSQLR